MRRKRVVITGIGAVSPFGRGFDVLFTALREGRSAVCRLPELDEVKGLSTRVAALVKDADMNEVPRKVRRSMSPMSVYAYWAANEAIAGADIDEETVRGGRFGLAMGSTLGSPHAAEEFFTSYFPDKSIERIKAMVFFRIMGHSAAANVAQALGIRGRVIAPTGACATSCQAVGAGYEAIVMNRQDFMLCGGADEYHPLTSATFDIMMAASADHNDDPQKTPRPFDAARSGVVCGEGAGALLLESLDSALSRGAPIFAELCGFSSTSDPSSIANPDPLPVYSCMKEALDDAEIAPSDISYVNAHATGTLLGDAAESRAIAMLFGDTVPVSGFKGHMGHTMAASGVLELAGCLGMMRHSLLIPTRNLDTPAPECGGINHIRELAAQPLTAVLKNNFAMGGINCSLVLRRYDD